MAIAAKKMHGYLNPSKDLSPEEQEELEELDKEEGGSEEAEAEGTLEGEFPQLYPALEANGAKVQDAAEELDPALLTSDDVADWDEEAMDELIDSFSQLPDEVQAAFSEAKGIPLEKAQQIADALAETEKITEAEPVAGFIFHVGAMLSTMDDGEDEDEDLDDEDLDEDDEEPEV